MEKPPARRATEIDRIIEHRKDRVVVGGFKKAFMPAVDKVLEIVSREPFKQIKSILAVYPMSIPVDGEKILAENTFTNWLGNGCHPISCSAHERSYQSITILTIYSKYHNLCDRLIDVYIHDRQDPDGLPPFGMSASSYPHTP